MARLLTLPEHDHDPYSFATTAIKEVLFWAFERAGDMSQDEYEILKGLEEHLREDDNA